MTGAYIGAADFRVQTVLEPGSMALVALALGMLAYTAHKRRSV
ncbi:MAG: hypothetical protein NTZ15_17170 [Burkholderiales bacterium]|nr:hypothetical protein [Burkholderiales bacterium]